MRTRMSASRTHTHAGLACAHAVLARLYFLAPVHENDVSASTYGHCPGSFLRLACARCRLFGSLQCWWKMMVCDKGGVWQSVGERWCETDVVCDKDVCVCVKDGVKDGVWQRWCVTKCWWKMVWERCCVTKMCVCVTKMCVKDGVWQSVGERWCGRRGAEEEEEAEEDNTGDADLKTRTPHNFVGKNQKSGWRVFYLLNGMCLSQPSSLYQRCFLFPLLKGPGFPTVFLENFPIFEGFLRAKCFPTVKARAQGCKKIKIK